MSAAFSPLEPARVDRDGTGVPYSARYGDVYHSRAGALAQAHHVFMRGNGLPQRWQGRSTFTVCETGFGLGRNFLALWQAWRDDPQRCARLHVVSVEAHPFTRPDLEELIMPGLDATLRRLARELLDAWPILLPGFHRLEFESGALTLTLGLGHAQTMLSELHARVDAYFLDGFAPDRNPEMWTPRLFGQMARLANAGATAASWCCASAVRRDLREAGFLVTKAPGFAGKREMMKAVLRPHLGRPPEEGTERATLAVVGGGVAGAGIAYSAACRGHDAVVVDPAFAQGLAGCHRGHHAAAMVPLVSRDDDHRARLSRAGLAAASLRWRGLAEKGALGSSAAVELADSLEEARQRRRALKELKFPPEWASWCEPAEVTRLAGLRVHRGGVLLPQAKLVRPALLLDALLRHPGIRTLSARAGRIARDPVQGWRVLDDDGRVLARADVLVLANGLQARDLVRPFAQTLRRLESMAAVAGQLSLVPAGRVGGGPRLIVCGDGYLLPAVDGHCAVGSTYQPGQDPVVTETGHRIIAEKLAGLIEVDALAACRSLDGGWAGRRTVVAGRLPVIAEVQAGLWLACAYGSRGFTWAALAGELLAARLNNEPETLERALQRAIARL